jgi:hypothetical protein
MHIQVVNFQLNDIDEQQYRQECDECAPVFATIPGLISKVWLADRSRNTYGGIYTWRDRQAMQDFLAGELFRSVRTDPHIRNLTLEDFDVLEGPTAATHGVALTRSAH